MKEARAERTTAYVLWRLKCEWWSWKEAAASRPRKGVRPSLLYLSTTAAIASSTLAPVLTIALTGPGLPSTVTLTTTFAPSFKSSSSSLRLLKSKKENRQIIISTQSTTTNQQLLTSNDSRESRRGRGDGASKQVRNRGRRNADRPIPKSPPRLCLISSAQKGTVRRTGSEKERGTTLTGFRNLGRRRGVAAPRRRAEGGFRGRPPWSTVVAAAVRGQRLLLSAIALSKAGVMPWTLFAVGLFRPLYRSSCLPLSHAVAREQ